MLISPEVYYGRSYDAAKQNVCRLICIFPLFIEAYAEDSSIVFRKNTHEKIILIFHMDSCSTNLMQLADNRIKAPKYRIPAVCEKLYIEVQQFGY